MQTLLICAGLIALFLILLATGHLRCRRGSPGGEAFDALTPNACVDLMEKQASQDAQDACVSYSNKCDAGLYGPYHSPICGAEISSLYAKFGITPGTAITDAQSSQIVHELGKGICSAPIKCSTSAQCPNPLQCSLEIGLCE